MSYSRRGRSSSGSPPPGGGLHTRSSMSMAVLSVQGTTACLQAASLLAHPRVTVVRMPTIFSKIVAGEIPAERLREDDDFLAFLDIRPIRPGHSLVIPKTEIDHFFDLPDD